LVRIRLKRFGSKNQPQWRVVVSDSKMPRDGRFIEEIGYYNPLHADEKIEVNQARLDYWLGLGAQPTETLRTLLKRSAKKARKS